MKKVSQRDTNPYPNSDTNKRYQTFDFYLRKRFGKKCAKIPLDGGFTCPNIDGTRGEGGCIYCLGGSAAVTAVEDSLERQYADGVASVSDKWKDFYTIPYLQAHTCTYGAPDVLRSVYEKCAAFPNAVMLAIATRADCLDDGVVEVLEETAKRIPVLVELGLQSANDDTARLINRGHTRAEFLDGYERLRRAAGDISVCIHMINGLPGEGIGDMLDTARFVAALSPDMVKIHLLHVLRGTRLYEMYESGEYVPMEREEYIRTVCDQIELMPKDTVIARLTGDGFSSDLAAPDWSRRKKSVINDIDTELYRRGSFQGMKFNK